MIVLDARDNTDRPKPANHCEFKAWALWTDESYSQFLVSKDMCGLQLNMDTVRTHLEVSDKDNVPALFNFEVGTWMVETKRFNQQTDWWLKVWKQIRQVNPSQTLGVYAEVPNGNYWAPVLEHEYRKNPTDAWEKARYEQETKRQIKEAKELNNRLARLTPQLDIICLSLYLYYPQHDNKQWAAFAKWNIAEAKQYLKPVYPVVMPRFNVAGTPAVELKRWKQFIDDIVKQKPDGIILWDYYEHGPYSQVQEQFEYVKGLAA